MRQFDICRLIPADATKRSISLVVILQADLLIDLDTRIVAPLVDPKKLPPLDKVRPDVPVGGKTFRLVTDRMSVVTRSSLGDVVASAEYRAWDIRRAMDLVFAGI